MNAAALQSALLKLELLAAAADEPTTDPATSPFPELLRIGDALEWQLRLAAGDLRGWLRAGGDALPKSLAGARQPDGNLAGALRRLVVQRLRFALEEPAATTLDNTDRERRGDGAGDAPPRVCVRIIGNPVALSPEAEVEVLAIVQEALLNAQRHGGARDPGDGGLQHSWRSRAQGVSSCRRQRPSHHRVLQRFGGGMRFG